ncbi:MAG TPA: hypothetical protein PLN13_05970 [Bacteroidia bacterium]|nr:hypothetical protein [Bacteroidia bacterium]HRH08111.1 hypothetical protein [Bacteroidia bacterium]
MSTKIDLENIFNEEDCPSEEQLISYYQKTMNKNNTHVVEHHLTTCEMCSDFIEGLQQSGSISNFRNDILELNKTVTPTSKIIRPEFNYKRYSIAATLLILLGIGFLFNYFLKENTKDSVVQINEKSSNKDLLNDSSATAITQFETDSQQIESSNIEKPRENKVVETPKLEKVKKSTEVPRSNDSEIEITSSSGANLTSGKAVFDSEMAASSSKIEQADAAVEYTDDIDKTIKESSNTIQGMPQAAESVEPRTIITTSKTTANKNSKYTSTNFIESAKEDLRNKNFASAIDKLTQQLEISPNDEEVLFMLGKTERLIKNFNVSTKYFDTILNNYKSPYWDETRWLKALNLLDSNKKNEAKKLLIEISKGNGKYVYPASEMLGELD